MFYSELCNADIASTQIASKIIKTKQKKMKICIFVHALEMLVFVVDFFRFIFENEIQFVFVSI